MRSLNKEFQLFRNNAVQKRRFKREKVPAGIKCGPFKSLPKSLPFFFFFFSLSSASTLERAEKTG